METLFRAKRKDTKEWVYWNVFGQIVCDDGKTFNFVRYDNVNYWNIVDLIPLLIAETVGQYTGLTDKNGVKIFEGDILKNTSNPGWALQLVKYGYCKGWVVDDFIDKQANPKTFRMKKCCYITASDIIYENIGNIHDNPELLEGAAE